MLPRRLIQSTILLYILTLVCLPASITIAQQKTGAIENQQNSYYPSFQPHDRYGDPLFNNPSSSPLFLKDPKNLNFKIEIDTGMHYNLYEKMNNLYFRPPSYMNFEEFSIQRSKKLKREYWQNLSRNLEDENAVTTRNLIPKLYIGPVLDKIFGGSYIELIPRGFVNLDFGGSWQHIENPSIPIRQQNNAGFQFDQQISLSVVGKVGEKLAITTNFDNNSSFDFQNNMRVEYTGFKEEILKKFEIGNVSLRLKNSLITGAQNLFGIKAQLQFGKLFMTAIASTQRGKQSSIEIPGGTGASAQGKPFEIIASNYDENRHFFLSHFFRDNYEQWLSTLPQITSGVNITRVEIYVLNRQNNTQTLRNVVGIMDMGESDKIYRKNILTTASPGGIPTNNDANTLFDLLKTFPPNAGEINGALESLGFVNGTDFEKITSARKLDPSEYTFNKKLGYITLERNLQNDEALAVAFEYAYNGKRYKVGELTEDYSNKGEEEVIYLKLIRPRKISIRDSQGNTVPTWKLMMKNIYNLNVSQLSKEGFQLRIIYRDDRTGIDNPQLQDGDFSRTKQLIEVFKLDRLNTYGDPQPDGNFDFVENITLNPEKGLIIFPLLRPFDTALKELFNQESNPNTRDFLSQKYLYDTLYSTTKAEAELVAQKNKFYITGSFKAGSGRDIIIQGFNITKESVKVYAGGIPLQEGTDYRVDYTFGKVTILNDGVLNSGKNITITYEQQDPFSFQTRTLLGTRFDYRLNKNINIGSTVLYYNEQPLIIRNLIGTEPSRNLQYGFDFNLKKDSRILTKMVDRLPFLQTKEKSGIHLNTEFAQLIPGTSNIINGEGTSFIDDFENSAIPYNLTNPRGWKLSSIPKTNNNQFDPTGGALNDITAGYKRAKIAWYRIDNQFYVSTAFNLKPPNITDKDLENHYVRAISPQEIFPFFDPFIGNFNEPILNLAYYPTERGPYNFNPDLNPNGTLKNPFNNWGGIISSIRTEVDFDKANIEYLEFWLMDPFIDSENGRIIEGRGDNQSNTTGGKLVFNIGSLSEDLIRDGEHAFENGLPSDGDITGSKVLENNWGYVTTQQFVNNAFDNATSARANQDVGMDGINDENETIKYSNFINNVPPGAQEIVLQDPAADNFQYFLDSDLDDKDAKILERYKNFNGMENNSPIISGNDLFTRSGTTIPDNEDLNQDNTLSDLEEYYEYDIDLRPSTLRVGRKYIVDQVSNQINGDVVTWYLFRIPVRQFDAKVGEINGFKSIRYIRMYATEFVQPVVLRMSKFRLIGSQWRRYTDNLEDARFGEPLEPNLDNFSVSVVNVEENGQGNDEKPPYIPPLRRDIDATSTIQRRLNEQAIQLCVTDLPDGDARAVFKNVSMDFFNYGRIKMFLSAHGKNLQDGQLQGFIRLGTDFNENYYEVAIPLKATKPGATLTEQVWPEENQIDLELNELYALKIQRDREGVPLNEFFPKAGPKQVGRHLIRIHGRPDLSQLKTIMIGVRNPKSDDAQAQDVCIWGNEMRLTDFDRTPGWAANAVLSAKLADFGNITGSARHISFGYGNVQSKISERARGGTTSLDISANFNLGRLLPKNFGLKIPVFMSLETQTINPNYDPANPDLRIDAVVKSFNTTAERNTYLALIRDRSERRSINFTNVKKVKVNPKAKKHIYDIENFSFTYSYSEATQTNFNLLTNTRRNTKGAIAWQYNSTFKGFEPFKNSKILSSPYLQLIKDFNINPVPASLAFRVELDRSFRKLVYRNATQSTEINKPNFQKFFTFNRSYTIQWNLTKGIHLTYNAQTNAIIDEPDGDIDTKEKQDIILNNLKKFGRTKHFQQDLTVNYKVPLDKIPFTNWLNGEYQYHVGYTWTAGPLENTDSLKLGNIIRNARDQTLIGKVDLLKLYNKIPFLKDINTPKQPTRPTTPTPSTNTAKGAPPPSNFSLLKGFLRLLMSVRNISGTYSVSEGTTLPGFLPSPLLFGLGQNWTAPGWRFILGDQNPEFRFTARNNNWLTQSKKLTTLYSQIRTEDISIQASFEPWNDITIQLTAKKNSNSSFQEIFRFDDIEDRFVSLNPSRAGSAKISIWSIGTSFKNNSSLNSSVFQQFEKNIERIQNRFRTLTNQEYVSKSQDILIPAFIAAYTGVDTNEVSLSPFLKIPFPGWSINYSGLNKINGIKDLFQSITISHAYSSTYSVVNYTNSLEYSNIGLDVPLENYNNNLFASVVNESGELIPIYIIDQVAIGESFAPLIGINIRTKKNITLRFDYKTNRDIVLNISNAQITELNNKSWSLEFGYTKNNFKLPWRRKGQIITLKNDITFRLSAGISDKSTIQRKINEVNILTNGNINFRLRPSINYIVNKALSVQLYINHNLNEPLVTNSYKRSDTQGGFKILFNLSQ